jgi:hypothetical protein
MIESQRQLKQEVDRLGHAVELQATYCRRLRHSISRQIQTTAQRPDVLLTLFGVGVCAGLLKQRNRSAPFNHARAAQRNEGSSWSETVATARAILALVRESRQMVVQFNSRQPPAHHTKEPRGNRDTKP